MGPQERAYELFAKKKNVVEEPAENKKVEDLEGGSDEEDGDEGHGEEEQEEKEEQEEQKEQREEKTVTGKKKKTLLVAKYLKAYDPKLRVGGSSFRTEQISQTVLRVLMRQFGRVHSDMVRSML